MNANKALLLIAFALFSVFITLYSSTKCLAFTSMRLDCKSVVQQNKYLGWPLKFVPKATKQDASKNFSYEVYKNYGLNKFFEGKVNYINLLVDSFVLCWIPLLLLMGLFKTIIHFGKKYPKLLSKKIF